MEKLRWFEQEIVLDPSSAIPLYRQLSEAVVRELHRNYVSREERLPSMLSLAEKYGLNRETVRKAYLLLEEDGVIERDGYGRGLYVSEKFLKRKAHAPLSAIGLVLPSTMQSILDSESQLPMHMVSGIMDTASAHEIASVIIPLPEDGKESGGFRHWLDQMMPSLKGLIFLGESRDSSHGKALDMLLEQDSIPQVFIGGKSFMEHLGTVEVDMESAARTVVDCLTEQGHRRFAVYGAKIPVRKKFQLQTIDRIPLFIRNVRARFPLPDSMIFAGNYREPSAAEWLRLTLSSPERPTAVLCAGAHEARQVVAVAHELGIGIPSQLSVVGYDLPPQEKLATIRYPYFLMGQSALEMITESWRRNTPIRFLSRRLTLSVMMHGSVGPCDE